MTANLTPADQGIIAAAIEGGIRQGLGDDGIIDEVAAELIGNGWAERDADRTAARAVSAHFRK